MNRTDLSKRTTGEPTVVVGDALTADKRSARMRRSMAVILLSLSTLVTACTPGEIQQSIEMLNVSFEDGGLEGGLSAAGLIGQNAVLVIGMRLGSLAP
jgi:hypothetical protein